MIESSSDLLQDLAIEDRGDGTTGETIFEDRLVSGVCDWVENSGVLDLVAQWRAEDKARDGKHPGGRTPIYGGTRDRLVIVLMMLLLRDSKAPQMAEMKRAVSGRFSGASRERLGLPPRDRASEEAIYSRVRRAWDRLTDTIDLAPTRLGKKRPTRAQVEEAIAARDPHVIAIKRERAHLFLNTILDASVRITPFGDLRTWRGNITFDATVALVRGHRNKTKDPQPDDKMNSDIDVEYHHNHDGTLDPGYHVHIALMAQNNADDKRTFPLLAIGASVDQPNRRVGENAVRVAQSIKERGYPVGLFTTDKGYYGNCKPEDFHQPIMRLGYGLVGTPKHTKNRSAAIQHTHKGALYIDGFWYSPGTPKDLINARVDYLNGFINEETYYQRGEKLQEYRFRPKGNGAHMCPAQGPSATMTCAHRNFDEPDHARRDGKNRAQVRHAPTDPLPVCLNSTSTSFPGFDDATIARFAQAIALSTREHQRIYRLHRSTIEGFNATTKDDRHEALGLTRNRRRRGMVHHLLVIAVTLAVTNMRKLKKFLKDKIPVNPHDPGSTQIDLNPYEDQIPESSPYYEPPPPEPPGWLPQAA